MTVYLVIAGVYAAASALSFGMMAWDKSAAGGGRRRVPERTLHAVELAGGWPGALAGMRLLRHKGRKRGYRGWLWSIILLHVLGWAGLFVWVSGRDS